MTTWPSFSIVTCSYQQGRFLESTLRSVLDQRYPALEYIVMDGGSQDGSVDIIRRYASQLSHWVTQKDRGQTDALNQGFARSTGDIQGWLCSDDLLLPGSLEAVARFFQAHPHVDAVYGDALWIDEEGNYLRPKTEMPFNRLAFYFDHNYIPQPSMFWRRRLFEKVGGLNEAFNLAMDNDLWQRFSEHSPIAHISQYLSCMRYYPEQKTRSMKPAGMREDEQIRQRWPLAKWAAPGSASRYALRTAARATRFIMKAAAGGYSRQPDASTLQALVSYRTPAVRSDDANLAA